MYLWTVSISSPEVDHFNIIASSMISAVELALDRAKKRRPEKSYDVNDIVKVQKVNIAINAIEGL